MKFRVKSITIDTQKDHHFTLSRRLVNNIILGESFSSLTPNCNSFDLHFPHCLQTFCLNISKGIKGVASLWDLEILSACLQQAMRHDRHINFCLFPFIWLRSPPTQHFLCSSSSRLTQLKGNNASSLFCFDFFQVSFR